MGFFSKIIEPEESKTDRLHHALTIAFDHVRDDFHKVTSWIHHFNQKHEHHEAQIDALSSRITELEETLVSMPKTAHEIKQIVDSFYSYESIHKRIEDINSRIASLESAKESTKQAILKQESAEVRVERQSNLKERIVSKIAKNSKEYVKSVILSLIRKYHSISGPQLKDIVVEEQGLCSKSSFYRLLEELEQESAVSVMQTGKEKNFIFKSEAQH